MNILKQITKNPKEVIIGRNSKEYIIVHDTDSPASFQNIINFFRRPDRLSIHYVISKEGEIVQYADDDDIAFHAGVSEWRGRRDMNQYSIGIEVHSKGDEFTDMQRSATVWLCRELMQKYNIPSINVLRHADVAMPRGRRSDIRPLFYQSWGNWRAFQRFLGEVGDYAKEKAESSSYVKEMGLSNGERPEDPITRAEVWVMLKRFGKLLNSGKL